MTSLHKNQVLGISPDCTSDETTCNGVSGRTWVDIE